MNVNEPFDCSAKQTMSKYTRTRQIRPVTASSTIRNAMVIRSDVSGWHGISKHACTEITDRFTLQWHFFLLWKCLIRTRQTSPLMCECTYLNWYGEGKGKEMSLKINKLEVELERQLGRKHPFSVRLARLTETALTLMTFLLLLAFFLLPLSAFFLLLLLLVFWLRTLFSSATQLIFVFSFHHSFHARGVSLLLSSNTEKLIDYR